MLNPLAIGKEISYSLPMMEKVVKYIEKYHMLVKEDKVIVGVSGGADSVCLLFVLLKLRKSMGIEIVAVHVNHGIRGASACEDEAFVRRLCGQHDVKCVVYHENVESIAKKRKQSVEEAGRDVRREAFEKTLSLENGTKIAMAHHQNDNAETLLMNLARGTGLRGLGGIQPVNGKTIRPLLCLNRNEIESYLNGIGCGWCQDETNEENDYTRNRLRHFVIPVLEEQVNAQAVRHMNEAMEQIRRVQGYLEMQADMAESVCLERKTCGEIQIWKAEFETQPEVIQSLLARRSIAKVAGSEKDISMVHVEAVVNLLGKQSGRSLDLPYGVSAVRNYGGMVLKKQQSPSGTKHIFQPLKIPGMTSIPELNLTICSRILEKTADFSVNQIPQKTYTKWFDYDIIKGNLIVRTRQAGDCIVIDKAGRQQKIKSYFINEKIPADKRDSLPMIADASQIVWILGYRMSSAYQVTDKTRQVLEIKVTEEE